MRPIVFWGVMIVLAVGVFIVVRYLTACWTLTALPGIPPTYCAGKSGTIKLDAPAAPIAGLPPTPDVAAPELQYPQWDGGSRINIVFFGLRGGDISGEDCPANRDARS